MPVESFEVYLFTIYDCKLFQSYITFADIVRDGASGAGKSRQDQLGLRTALIRRFYQ